jgi:hypothetical protein
MSGTLFLQLASSFVLAGSVITILSLIAERANEKVAGIIMMFPSTIVLGFFFLGLSTSAQSVANVVPATLIPLGMVAFSSVIYIFSALFYSRFISSKLLQILATIATSSLMWFIMASPFAIWRPNRLALGILGYFCVMLLAHYLLNRYSRESPQKITYSRTQILFRAVFIGSIIATIVFLGKTLDPFWGGVFTMYPAATFAGLMIFHFYYQPHHLFGFMKRAPIGTLGVFVYAICAMLFFPVFGLAWGTLVSYLISMAFSLTLVRSLQRQA